MFRKTFCHTQRFHPANISEFHHSRKFHPVGFKKYARSRGGGGGGGGVCVCVCGWCGGGASSQKQTSIDLILFKSKHGGCVMVKNLGITFSQKYIQSK